MTETDEIARAKARIRLLAARTVENGCTDAEAMAAAEMIGRLLDRYMLSMDEVAMRASPCIQRSVPIRGRRRGAVDACVPAIARFCHCLVWVEEAPPEAGETEAPSPAPPPRLPGRRYAYFGLAADVEMALYLHSVLTQAIASETAAFSATPHPLAGAALRLARRSFQHGLVTRLADRLDALHAAREAAFRATEPQGTALVLAKQTVVREAFAETRIRLARRAARPLRIEPRAFGAGKRAGDRINLERPLGHAARARLS